MNDSITLRPIVRETMQLAPARKWTVKALHAQIRAEYPQSTEQNVNAAMLWNQSRGHVDYEVNDETGQELWALTAQGKAAE
jgi:hypothetical protein